MNNQLAIYQRAFLDYLEEERFLKAPNELYDPINYILDIGGKRMRPILLLAGCGAFKEKWQDALPAALGVEIFHNFTLLHDDIMDEADLRRNKPTTHKVFGQDSAILSGDAMMLISLQYVVKSCSSHNRSSIVDGFVQVGLDICIGQQLDMNFESLVSPSLELYLDMIEGKTAVLPAEALRIGALIGGASAEQADVLKRFGLNLGMAFQMQDDWLDLYGDAELVGKTAGGDILRNKKTILFVMAMKEADDVDRNMLKQLFAKEESSSDKVEKVREIFDKYKVGEKVDALKQHYHKLSLSALDELEIHANQKQVFIDLAEMLLNRKK